MLKRSELTERKFCTNCDESVLRTVNTPASLKEEANSSERPGKAKIEPIPTARLGRITLNNVWIWTLARSLASTGLQLGPPDFSAARCDTLDATASHNVVRRCFPLLLLVVADSSAEEEDEEETGVLAAVRLIISLARRREGAHDDEMRRRRSSDFDSEGGSVRRREASVGEEGARILAKLATGGAVTSALTEARRLVQTSRTAGSFLIINILMVFDKRHT
jgi:hypothetical protein